MVNEIVFMCAASLVYKLPILAWRQATLLLVMSHRYDIRSLKDGSMREQQMVHGTNLLLVYICCEGNVPFGWFTMLRSRGLGLSFVRVMRCCRVDINLQIGLLLCIRGLATIYTQT